METVNGKVCHLVESIVFLSTRDGSMQDSSVSSTFPPPIACSSQISVKSEKSVQFSDASTFVFVDAEDSQTTPDDLRCGDSDPVSADNFFFGVFMNVRLLNAPIFFSFFILFTLM